MAEQSSLRDEVAAAFAWWREAGVDCDFADEPTDWIAPPAQPEPEPERQLAAAPRPQAPPKPKVAPIAMGGLPQDLAGFRAWWLGEPSLDSGQVHARVPPRGAANAPLMVLVDHPEADDRETLLSASQGNLLGGILAALGFAPEAAYVASAIPRHMPLPDWDALCAAGLGEVALHHIRLAAPQRLIVFGSHVSSLLGHDPANNPGFLPKIHHDGGSLPLLVAPGLDVLLRRPRGKARLWDALLDWTGQDAT